MKRFKISFTIILAALLIFSQLDMAVHATKQPSKNAPAVPVNLQVPNLAYDEDSITLVWEKPADYRDIVDFNVYMDGKKIKSNRRCIQNGKLSPLDLASDAT